MLFKGLLILLAAEAKTTDDEARKARALHWRQASRAPISIPLRVFETISRTSPAVRSWMQGRQRIDELHRDHGDDASENHIACGPLSSAKRLRQSLLMETKKIEVLYTNREEDAVCWIVLLRASEARRVMMRKRGVAETGSEHFFHIEQLPLWYKLLDVVDIESGSMSPAPKLKSIDNTFLVHTEKKSNPEKPLEVLKNYNLRTVNEALEKVFGCQNELSLQVCAQWQSILPTSDNECTLPSLKERSGRRLRLQWDIVPTSKCALSVLLYLSAQSNVRHLEMLPRLRATQEHLSLDNDISTTTVSIEASADLMVSTGSNGTDNIVKPMNEYAAVSLQGGASIGDTPLWDAGLNGEGQYIQVTDTGLDDASCWFEDDIVTNATLSGAFESDLQVLRSTYDEPITDLSRRKVVQYIAYPSTGSSYDYDYESGHGTHCAGSIAGSMKESESDTNCTKVLLSYGYSNLDGVYEKVNYEYSSSSDANFYFYSAETDLYFYRVLSAYWCLSDTLEATSGLYSYSQCSLTQTPEIFRDCPEATPNPLQAAQCIDETAQGMAPQAKLMAFDFGDDDGGLAYVPDMYEMMFTPAYEAGARISSNSWGGGYEYYSDAQSVDEFMFDFPSTLILFAAGNDGDEIGASSVLSPGVAKNCLTVGAAENSFPVDTVAYFSSRGPTSDGRIKPDVLSVGDPIASASASGFEGLSSCSATWKSGTSMACPTLAGLSALFRQFLVENRHAEFSEIGYNASSYNATEPSGALLKAMLIASAQPIHYGYDQSTTVIELSSLYSSSPPDYHQGFGTVNATQVLPLSTTFELFLHEAVLTENDRYDIGFIASGATDLSVVLTWTDPPASTFCSTCLVHDLDLEVWIDGARMYANFGEDVEDTVNNVEKIATNVSSAAAVDIRVKSGFLAYADTQSFALVVTGNLSPQSVPTSTPTSEPTRVTSCDYIDISFGYSNTDGLFARVDHTYEDNDVEVDYYLENKDLPDTYIYRYLGMYWILGTGSFDGTALLFTQCDELSFPDALTSCTWNLADAPTYTCYSATAIPTVEKSTPMPSLSPSTLAPTRAATLACERNDDCPLGQKCSSSNLISSIAATTQKGKEKQQLQRRHPLFITYHEDEYTSETSGICVDENTEHFQN